MMSPYRTLDQPAERMLPTEASLGQLEARAHALAREFPEFPEFDELVQDMARRRRLHWRMDLVSARTREIVLGLKLRGIAAVRSCENEHGAVAGFRLVVVENGMCTRDWTPGDDAPDDCVVLASLCAPGPDALNIPEGTELANLHYELMWLSVTLNGGRPLSPPYWVRSEERGSE